MSHIISYPLHRDGSCTIVDADGRKLAVAPAPGIAEHLERTLNRAHGEVPRLPCDVEFLSRDSKLTKIAGGARLGSLMRTLLGEGMVLQGEDTFLPAGDLIVGEAGTTRAAFGSGNRLRRALDHLEERGMASAGPIKDLPGLGDASPGTPRRAARDAAERLLSEGVIAKVNLDMVTDVLLGEMSRHMAPESSEH